MGLGKWYLVYMADSGTIHYPGSETEILLNAVTEEDAIVEAEMKWAKILAEANTNWEKEKAELGSRASDTAFDGMQPNPHIVYIIPLK